MLFLTVFLIIMIVIGFFGKTKKRANIKHPFDMFFKKDDR